MPRYRRARRGAEKHMPRGEATPALRFPLRCKGKAGSLGVPGSKKKLKRSSCQGVRLQRNYKSNTFRMIRCVQVCKISVCLSFYHSIQSKSSPHSYIFKLGKIKNCWEPNLANTRHVEALEIKVPMVLLQQREVEQEHCNRLLTDAAPIKQLLYTQNVLLKMW